MIRDRYTLGILTGLIAQIPKYVLSRGLVALNIAQLLDPELAAGIFLARKDVLTPLGLLVGSIAAFFIAAVLGLGIVYLISLTGKDFWWVKGLSIGGVYWVGFYGLLRTLGGTKVQPLLPIDNLLNLGLYGLWGLACSYLALRWGDNSLFKGIKHIK